MRLAASASTPSLLVPVLRPAALARSAPVAGGDRWPARSCCPNLGQDLFPTFKEQDLLMHFDTKPGTSLPEMKRDRRQRCSASCWQIPGGDAGRRAHRPGAARRGDRRARVLRAVDHARAAAPTSSKTAERGARGRRLVPGHLPRPHHVPARADRRDDLQRQRGSRACASRARTSAPCSGISQQVNDDAQRHARTWSICIRSRRASSRRSRRRSTPPAAARYGLTPGDVRRAGGDDLRQRRRSGSSWTGGVAIGVIG